MMFIRGSLEQKVRDMTRENELLLRKAARLSLENATLRGQRDEAYRTIERYDRMTAFETPRG